MESVDQIKSSFERAMSFFQAGDAQMAEQITRNALQTFADDGNLLCLHGASLARMRRLPEAEQTLLKAVKLYPDFARARDELGSVLFLQNRAQESLEHFEVARKLEPKNADVLMKYGRALAALNRAEEADQLFEESFKLTPHRFQIAQAAERYAKGERKQAEQMCREVLKQDPHNVDALRFLAEIATHHRQWGDAEALLTRATAIAPDYLPTWRALIETYREQDKFEETLDTIEQALKRDPDNANIICERANIYSLSSRHEDSIEQYNLALQKAPLHAGALSGLGHVLKTVGQTEEAIAAYRQSTEAHPSIGEAYWSLANLKTFRFEDQEINSMKSQLDNKDLPEESATNFCFALAKSYEDRKDYANAFEYYDRGNGIRRMNESYDPVQTEVIHDRIIETFTKEYFEQRQGWGDPGADPILIVGLPRSGSTLLEQILASHSQVEGTFELPELPRVIRSINNAQQSGKTYPEATLELTQDESISFGKQYLEGASKYRTEMPFFTDKMPNNFPNVGLLHLLLPNAKVINARRHPLDSCLGSFKQLFAKGQTFSYDLIELGEYYLQYQRMIDHWAEVLPGKVLELHYEDMVDDQETQTRRMLEHCGLPWEERCLRFYESDRAVRTASSEQVRRPIYSTSVNLWRHYEEELEPLIEVLEPLLMALPEADRPKLFQTMK